MVALTPKRLLMMNMTKVLATKVPIKDAAAATKVPNVLLLKKALNAEIGRARSNSS